MCIRDRILRDGQRFGDDYCMLLSAAYREVIASHKLVKTDDGKLLYVSKNCTAGGFAAATAVTYASSPLFLLYNPSRVFAELNGICDFARSEMCIRDRCCFCKRVTTDKSNFLSRQYGKAYVVENFSVTYRL